MDGKVDGMIAKGVQPVEIMIQGKGQVGDGTVARLGVTDNVQQNELNWFITVMDMLEIPITSISITTPRRGI